MSFLGAVMILGTVRDFLVAQQILRLIVFGPAPPSRSWWMRLAGAARGWVDRQGKPRWHSSSFRREYARAGELHARAERGLYVDWFEERAAILTAINRWLRSLPKEPA